jgi:hypothetical protein
MDDEVQVGNSGSIAAQDFFERWLECDSIRFPGSSEFAFAKGSYQAATSTILKRPRPLVGINAGGVNEARTRVINLGRVTYVGEDANGNVRKGTEETVFLSIWCQRMTQALSPAYFCLSPILTWIPAGLSCSQRMPGNGLAARDALTSSW